MDGELAVVQGRAWDLGRYHHPPTTKLLEASVHPKVVSEAFGHSLRQRHDDTYQHLMPTMQDAATRAIEEAIGHGAAGLDDA